MSSPSIAAAAAAALLPPLVDRMMECRLGVCIVRGVVDVILDVDVDVDVDVVSTDSSGA
jgi:hypothetical protein